MGNKTYCFTLLMRKLFGSGAKLKPEDTCGKERERKEWVQGRSKSSYPPSMGGSKVPPAATDKVLERTLSEAEEEHNKHAMAVAIATAAAAEAAVAAAQAAARVVRLTGKGGSYHQMDFTRKESAAIRIQSAFRGYLARKALRALKGLVKLQALVRGHMVRRHAESAFRSMQALHRVQSQVCSRRVTMAEDKKTCEHKLHVQRHAEAVREIDGSNTRRRDDSQLPVGQPGRSLFSGEATFKRERTREHYLDCRDKRAARTPTSSTSSVKQCNSNTKNIERSWIERWLEAQSHRRGSETSSASSVDQNSFSERQIAEAKICLDALFREQEVQSKLNIREGQGRRRLMRSQSPVTNRQKLAQRVMIRDDQSYASSTTSLPSYMVYTESSKAKARSNSTPRQRVSTSSMDKNSFPCVNSNIMVLKRSSSSQQKSPGLKSQPGPVKSDRIIRPIRDLGVNLDQSLVNWDHQRAFR